MKAESNSNWGNYIILSFIIFIGIMASMVVVSMKQDIPLVSRDYYEKEIKFQNEIDAISNAKNIENQVSTYLEDKNLHLKFSDIMLKKGILEIYSPLGAKHDRLAEFSKNDVIFNVKNMKPGNYKIKIFWTDLNAKPFQINRSLYIP
ncbi:MAG: FixH family protein [Cytophagales bacterium]